MKARRWRLGVLPLVVFYVLFFLLPQVSFLIVSLYRSVGPGHVGGSPSLANYASVLHDGFFLRAIVNTLELGVTTALASVTLALPIAFVITHIPRLGRYLFVLVIATMFSSAVAMAIGWQTLLAPSGGINGLLLALHLISEPLPLSANFNSVLIGTVQVSIPIAVLGLVPVFEALSRQQLEVSAGLGASVWTTLRYVIIPQAYRGTLSIALLIFAVMTSAFTTPALLGGGQVALLPLAIRQQLLTTFDYPTAAALATILIVITLVVSVATRLLLQGRDSMGFRSSR